MLLVSSVFEYIKSGKTAYVITDRRAISFVGGRHLQIKSFKPEMLKRVYRNQKNNGSGDVVIQLKNWKDSDGDVQTEEVGFLRVREVKRVEGLLKALAERK